MSAADTPDIVFRRRRRWLFLAVTLTAVAVCAVWLGLNPRLPVLAIVDRLRAAGPWVFFLAMALLPVVGFPLAVFNLAAGPAFADRLGLWLVLLLAVAAIMVNSLLSYWLARHALRPAALRLVRYLGYAVPEVSAQHHFHLSLLVRITPGPPYFIQSYLLGLSGVAPVPYLSATCVVAGAYAAAAIVGGDALKRGDVRMGIVALSILGVAALLFQLLRTRGVRS